MDYTVMIIDDDGQEHEIHVQANGVMEARDNAEQEAAERSIRFAGIESVENLTAINKWIKDARELNS